MHLYTIQLAQWRIAKARGIELLDITVRTGDQRFSPTWDLVKRYKDNQLTQAQYQNEYTYLMRASYKRHYEAWLELLRKPQLALACYCAPGAFCHRLLLAGFLNNVAQAKHLPFEYKGEITKELSP